MAEANFDPYACFCATKSDILYMDESAQVFKRRD